MLSKNLHAFLTVLYVEMCTQGIVSEGVSGRWGYPDTRKIYLVLWTFLFAFVLYRELLLLTRYIMCKDRQKGLGGRGKFAARPETPTVRTPGTPSLTLPSIY